MAFRAIKVVITGVDKGEPRVTVRAIDEATGAFSSQTREIKDRQIGEHVSEMLDAVSDMPTILANMKRVHDLAQKAAKEAGYTDKEGA